MIVSLLLTVEGSHPKISRLVNVEDSMHLGALSHVIEAAFGFSGGESHMYMGPHGEDLGSREVITGTPGAGERAETELTVAEMRPMTYVYDPSAGWNIDVEVLGTSRLDGPTPLLIDALGPDVVEACNGPHLMGKFHTEARRIAAGLDPDMEVAPLLLSFLPVMSPERLLQRLTQADPVTVAERISFVAEDLMIDSASTMPEDPRAPQFAIEFEEFLESRPDLQEIMSIDPNPEHNPQLIAAMAAFFEDMLDTDTFIVPDEPQDKFYNRLVAVLHYFEEPVKLTPSGYLPTLSVKALGDVLGCAPAQARPRESSVPPVAATRTILLEAGLLERRGNSVGVGERGHRLMGGYEHLWEFNDALRRGFEAVLGSQEWRAVVGWIAQENDIIRSRPQRVPSDLATTYKLLEALGVVEEGEFSDFSVTHGGTLLIERMLGLGE